MPSIVKLTLESNQYERNLKKAQKQWNDFMRGMGMSVQKFTAVGAAVAGVTGALKVAKDAFFANEKQLDEWNRTVEASKSVYNGFLSALNTGDISGFLSNIDQIVSAARDAYNALDELQTYQAYNQVQDARSRANYAKALDAYKLNPSAENKAALAAANQSVIENIKQEQAFTQNAYTEALSKLATERGLKGQNRQDFIDMFKNKSYNEMLTIKNKYDEGKAGRMLYYGDRVLGNKIQNRDTGVWREMDENERKEFEFARALNQLNDEQIKATQALGKQAEMLDEAVWQQDRAYNRLAGNNASGKTSSGGGGGSKSGGTTKQVRELTEMQSNQQRINELTQEYVNISDNATADVVERQKEIRNEIALLNQRNNQLKLYSEQAQGKLQGGYVMQSNLGGDKQWNPSMADKSYLNIGAGLDSETLAKMNSVGDAGNDAAKSWASAANAISGVGSALNSIEDPAAKVMGIVAQAIATVAAAHAQALETDWSSKSSIYAFIAAAAASTASMISMISAIHSATGYAQGGIVEGKSYSGDNIPAMLNAGEIVLSKSMQSTLAANLTSQDRGLNIVGELQGEKIVLVANRYFKRTGQGEIVTW